MGNNEYIPSTGELSEIVFGQPLSADVEQAMLRTYNESCQSAYQSAVDRGDERAIADAEQRLDALYAEHPELR